MSYIPRKTITYAHKKKRTVPSADNLSSPLNTIDQEDITRSEMSRRMLKRSRRSDQTNFISECSSNPVDAICAQERRHKRLKPSPIVLGAQKSVPMTLDDLFLPDYNDPSQFQTPHPSLGTDHFMLNASQGEKIFPEQFSPVPLAHRILARTSSRNLKENSSRKNRSRTRARALASPFTSRPGSTASSPNKLQRSAKFESLSRDQDHSQKKSRSSRTKSRTLSNSGNKFSEDQVIGDVNHIVRLNHSTANSPQRPAKSFRHNRRPSAPTPPHSKSFQNISPQDWLIPPKAISHGPLTYTTERVNFDRPPSELGFFSASFFGDVDIAAVSTPFLQRSQPFPDNCRGVDRDQEKQQTNNYRTPELTQNSDDEEDNTANQIPFRRHRRTRSPRLSDSIIPYTETYSFSHSPGQISDGCGDYLIPVAALTSSPSRLTEPSHPAWSEADLMKQYIVTTPPLSPPTAQHLLAVKPLEKSAGDKLQDMFSSMDLDLDTIEVPTRNIESCSHLRDPIVSGDSSIGKDERSMKFDSLIRSRSLDSAAEILTGIPLISATKDKKRNRRGTIRASDFMQPASNPTLSNGARRTRSGTVVGPPKPPVSTVTRLPEHVTGVASTTPASHRPRATPLDLDLESDDEILLKEGHWFDEDWQVAPAPAALSNTRNKKAMPALGGLVEEGSGSPDPLLLVARVNWSKQ